jgi:hypothetical protein
MFKAAFDALARRRARRDEEKREKTEAAQSLKRASLLQCNDGELARRLGLIAEKFVLYGYGSRKGNEAGRELHDGLSVLRRRVKSGEADQHQALSPIIQELVALPATEVDTTRALAQAVINGTKKNPWRILVNAPRTAPAGHLAPG